MSKRKLIIKLCFRERITEEVYLFDILARIQDEEYPHIIGRILVNAKKEMNILYMNAGSDLSDEYELIALTAYSSAKNIQKLI